MSADFHHMPAPLDRRELHGAALDTRTDIPRILVWTFKEPQTRATITVNDRNTMTFNWEWKNSGTC